MTVFQVFSSGVFMLQAAQLLLMSAITLPNFRSFVGSMLEVKQLEKIAMSSNAGSYVISGRFEHCFVLFTGCLLLSVALYVPYEDRGVPALLTAFSSAVLSYSMHMISTNTFHIKVFSGSVTQALGPLSYFNGALCLLYAGVSVGTFMGYAKSKAE